MYKPTLFSFLLTSTRSNAILRFRLTPSLTTGPLEPLESLDHEDHEHGDTAQNVDISIPPKASPKSVAAAANAASESPVAPQENHHHVKLTTAQEENELLAKETVSSTSNNKKTDEEEAAREASINIIVEGFRALLWAELEKVNARYEAQERIAGVTMERLNASVSRSLLLFVLSI